MNGTAVPYIQPFAQQMGMANGAKPGGINGKYNEMARMAMSHPAFLNQAEQRPQVVFGSHSQFEVNRSFAGLLQCHLPRSYFQISFTLTFTLLCQNIKKRQMSAASSGVMGRKDIFYSGSLYNIPEFK